MSDDYQHRIVVPPDEEFCPHVESLRRARELLASTEAVANDRLRELLKLRDRVSELRLALKEAMGMLSRVEATRGPYERPWPTPEVVHLVAAVYKD